MDNLMSLGLVRPRRGSAAARRRNADADEQTAGDGRPEARVVRRPGAVADRREGVKHEVAHQPPEPQRDRPRRLELPQKPRVGESGDDGDCAERENALELEIHLHPDDQVVHEMGDRRGGGDGKDDPLGSHLPISIAPGLGASAPGGAKTSTVADRQLSAAASQPSATRQVKVQLTA